MTAIIEAAARAVRKAAGGELNELDSLRLATAALAAVTPLIEAQALERAALALEQSSGQFLTANMNEHYAALIRTLKEQP